MLDRTKAPEFRKITTIDIQKAKTIQLSNGIPIHFIDGGTQPVIKLEFMVHSGKWFESMEGASFFTARMLTEGTAKLSANEISNTFDKFGAFIDVIPGFDYINLNLYCLGKYFDQLVPLLYEMFFNASFPDRELEILKNNTIQEIKVKDQKNSIVAIKKFRDLIFGSYHPYGKSLAEEDIAKIDRDILLNHYSKIFRNNPEIILSGSIEDGYIKTIDQYFGREPYGLNYEANKIKPFQQPGDLLIQKEKSAQSSIRIGKLLFNKNHPDYLKMIVVNEVLGGYFGSRLMKNIREEKGYTYGIYSRIMNFKYEGYFVIGTDVKKEFTRDTIAEINKEIAKMQQEPINDEELEMVKNQMIGAFLGEINSPFALADKFKNIYFHDLDYTFYQDFIQTINDITADEIMMLSLKYLEIDSLTSLVVGDK